jgi:hypothetical protein
MSHRLELLLDSARRAECVRNDECMFGIGRRVFNTGRVLIGSAYTPNPAPLDADGSLLQRALTDPRTAQPQTLPRRFLGFIWRLA